jgi:hypothetical protein
VLVGACQPYGTLEILGLVQLDVDAKSLRQPPGEELGLLEWSEMARVREPRLERLQVRLHGGGER